MPRIFISYRRDDSSYPTDSICRRLQQRFGNEAVFRDIDNIRPGEIFSQRIRDSVASCDVFLAVIGSRWLDMLSERQNDAKDFVRLEAEAALDIATRFQNEVTDRHIVIVPVLLDRISMPSSSQLPSSLEKLTEYSAAEVRPGRDFDSDVESLLDCIEQSLEAAKGLMRQRSNLRVATPTADLRDELNFDSESTTPVHVPSHHLGSVVPPEYFIGRTRELDEGERSVKSRDSFLILGPWRSGKTSYGKMLIHRVMRRPGNTTLGVYLNVEQWREVTVSSFLEHTLLGLSAGIARHLFNLKYKDLFLEDPTSRNPELKQDAAFSDFFDNFRYIRSRSTTQEGSWDVEDADLVEIHSDLLSVLSAKGWNRCFVLFDEANRLPRELPLNQLASHQEALADSGVTSLFAASPAMVDSSEEFQKSFVREIQLGPLSGPEELCALLDTYYFDEKGRSGIIPVTPAAIERLWTLSNGMPFLIQLLADRSFSLAHRAGAKFVSERYILDSKLQLEKEKPEVFSIPIG